MFALLFVFPGALGCGDCPIIPFDEQFPAAQPDLAYTDGYKLPDAGGCLAACLVHFPPDMGIDSTPILGCTFTPAAFGHVVLHCTVPELCQ